jgi:hypothetical protein
MTQGTTQDHISKKRVVYEMDDAAAVAVDHDVEFRAADGGVLTMDVYHPPDARAALRRPLVVIVAGYPDAGFQKFLGCRFKDMASSTCWARLIAASGMTAIAYTNSDPVADLQALLGHVEQNAAHLNVDGNRIGLWASSGNVPLALSLLMQDAPARVACAAFLYGYLLDLEGATGVADAARNFRFVNPCAGKSIDDLRKDVPLFVARAGQDQMPGLNEAMDGFLSAALAANLPLTFVNHPAGPHAFDLFHDSEISREIVRQALAFLRFHLGGV